MSSHTEWRMRSTRPSRPPYVPPHLRSTSIHNEEYSGPGVSFTVTVPNEPNPSWYANESYTDRYDDGFSSRAGFCRGRDRGRSRGRSRGRGLGRRSVSSRVSHAGGSSPIPESPFDDDTGDGEVKVINFEAYEDIPVEASGVDIPPPVKSFEDIDLGSALEENIRRCKYVRPTPIQRYAIPIAIAGRDLMACAQTGSGKTAAFCLPIIYRTLNDISSSRSQVSPWGGMQIANPLALILSPTRELSCQIHEEAKRFSYQTGLKIVVAYGGAPIGLQLRNLEKGVDILVATPGRLVDMIERLKVSLSKIRYLILDEADRMLDMGFEPQIRKLVEQLEMPPAGVRQTMLFSATFPTEIQRLASDFLSDYIFLAVGRVGSSTDLIVQRVEYVHERDKRKLLMKLLCEQMGRGEVHEKHILTLVFVETKRGADALEQWLSSNGFPSAAIHGDKVQMERQRALKFFKNGSTPILVATDVASRGLDIPHVGHVINFDLPKGIDDYVHRIGRTGRAGNSGIATAFFSEKNHYLAKPLVELMKETNQEIPSWLSKYSEEASYNNNYLGTYRGRSNFGGRDFRRAGGMRESGENYFHSYGQNVSNDGQGDPYSSTSNAFTYGAPFITECCTPENANTVGSSAFAEDDFLDDDAGWN